MKPLPQFLWGTSTSSHQVEGNNTANDWWEWEIQGKLKEASGPACDHYRRYESDFDIVAKLGQNAHRFSIEWSRLEPEENAWDEEAFRHYERVLKALHERGLEPVVTLHHFTNPLWYTRKGGWLNKKTPFYFARFTQKCVERFGKYVRFWVTINEPLVYLYHGFFAGLWPPGIKSFTSSMKVFRNQLRAHVAAYQVIHNYYKKELNLPVWVSIAKHLSHFMPCNQNSWKDRLTVKLRSWLFNDLFLNAAVSGFFMLPGQLPEFLKARNTLDFIGVNYYTRDFIRFGGSFVGEKGMGVSCEKTHHPTETGELNMMGWEVYPEGLYHVLKKLKRFNLPVVITENGIATLDDNQRAHFIQNHLSEVGRAAKEGINIQGYFYWSLLDNFEWAHGFGPRFGIVEVDYQSQTRKVRESAYVLRDMCRKLMGSC